MKTIKKTTLIAAITAVAAFAVPSMASASVWGPLNTNQSLDSGSVAYNTKTFGWTCNSQHLGTHVRALASSTLDVTSASWTGCHVTSFPNCTLSIASAGLPWTAVGGGAVVAVTWHALMTFGGFACPLGTGTLNLDGSTYGAWSASTHKITFTAAGGLNMSYGGIPAGAVSLIDGTFTNPTQTLTLT